MLQLLKNLRFHAQGKEVTDADILKWANNKVKHTGRTSKMENFKVKKVSYISSINQLFKTCFINLVMFYQTTFQDKNLSNGIFFLELLSAVEPRVVNWNLVTKGESGMAFFPLCVEYFLKGQSFFWLDKKPGTPTIFTG